MSDRTKVTVFKCDICKQRKEAPDDQAIRPADRHVPITIGQRVFDCCGDCSGYLIRLLDAQYSFPGLL